MVSSSHPAVSFVGARVLTDGGNAIDATLAMAAIAWLVLPGQCGIGGDAFAIVREPDGRVWTIGGSGFGPDGGTPDFYRDKGLSAIPLDGALAVAVPGTPAALAQMHVQGGTLALPDLWEPAARLAENGLACSAKTAADVKDVLRAILFDGGTGGGLCAERSAGARGDARSPTRSGAHDPHAGPRHGELLHGRTGRTSRHRTMRGGSSIQW